MDNISSAGIGDQVFGFKVGVFLCEFAGRFTNYAFAGHMGSDLDFGAVGEGLKGYGREALQGQRSWDVEDACEKKGAQGERDGEASSSVGENRFRQQGTRRRRRSTAREG